MAHGRILPSLGLAALATTGALVCSGILATHAPQARAELLLLPCAVMASALRGRLAGFLASILATLGYDWFFLPPFGTLRVLPSHASSLLLFLAIALVVGQLAARLHLQTDLARRDSSRTKAFAELARELSGALVREQVVQATVRAFQNTFSQTPILSLCPPDDPSRQPSGNELPLRAPRKVRGWVKLPHPLVSTPDLELASSFASQAAVCLERIHFVEVAKDATIRMEGEKLKAQLLASVSHDLRTPLTSMTALAEGILAQLPIEGGSDLRPRATSLASETRRMALMVDNLLEHARLQSGGITLRWDWNQLEELVGSALVSRRSALENRKVVLDLPGDPPLFWCDGLLVERVLVNLLDNAIRHTPEGTALTIWARFEEETIQIGLDDEGSGFPPDFVLSDRNRTGIGLALCRTISDLHGGTLAVDAHPGGGARVGMSLPRRTDPPPNPPDPT